MGTNGFAINTQLSRVISVISDSQQCSPAWAPRRLMQPRHVISKDAFPPEINLSTEILYE